MAYYVQFFYFDLSGNLSEGCGDRSVIRVDGRMRQERMEELAAKECKQRGYLAWQLLRGESLLRAKPFTKVVPLYSARLAVFH